MRHALVAVLSLISVGCTNCATAPAAPPAKATPSFGIRFHDPFDPKAVYACGQLEDGTLDCMLIERFEMAKMEAEGEAEKGNSL